MTKTIYELPKSLSDTNATKTFAYKDEHGNRILRLSILTKQPNQNGKEYHLLAETALYWYPLYSFYDWKYDYKTDKVVLQALKGTQPPKETQELIKQGIQFEDCIQTKPPFKGFKNKIYEDNISALYSMKQLGLVTMLDSYNQEDIKSNFQKIDKILNTVHNELAYKQLKDTENDELINKNLSRANDSYGNHTLYLYAEDADKRLLIKCGIAYKMTTLMRKTLNAPEYVSIKEKLKRKDNINLNN